jgi:hypothetical protein
MTNSTISRRAFLTGSAIAAGGVLMAGRLVFVTATRIRTGQEPTQGMGPGNQRVAPYLLDLPHPPTNTG